VSQSRGTLGLPFDTRWTPVRVVGESAPVSPPSALYALRHRRSVFPAPPPSEPHLPPAHTQYVPNPLSRWPRPPCDPMGWRPMSGQPGTRAHPKDRWKRTGLTAPTIQLTATLQRATIPIGLQNSSTPLGPGANVVCEFAFRPPDHSSCAAGRAPPGPAGSWARVPRCLFWHRFAGARLVPLGPVGGGGEEWGFKPASSSANGT